MGLDIRLPLGLIFSIMGAMMAIYGLMTRGSAMYAVSMGMNINLIWGVLMLVFGLGMLITARRSKI